MLDTKEKRVLILSAVMAIVSLVIIIGGGVSYQMELRNERTQASYFGYEYEINETVEVDCQFTAALEYHSGYYWNTGHTATAIFTIKGTNYSLTLQVDRQSYVSYSGIELTHVSNGTVVEYEISEGIDFFLNKSSDWISVFKIEYSYTYLKCTSYAGSSCYSDDYVTITGGTSSGTYHFAPNPAFPLHPVVTGILIALIITGVVLVIRTLVHANRRVQQAIFKPRPSFGPPIATGSSIPQSASPPSINTNLNTLTCPACKNLNDSTNIYCIKCGFKMK